MSSILLANDPQEAGGSAVERIGHLTKRHADEPHLYVAARHVELTPARAKLVSDEPIAALVTSGT